MEENSLAHYGVLGMKWGVRKDGMPQGYQGSSRKTKKARKQMQKQIRKMHTERIYDNKSGIGKNTARVNAKIKKDFDNKNSRLAKEWDKEASVEGGSKKLDRIEKQLDKNYDDIVDKYEDEYLDAAVKDLGFDDINYGRQVIDDLDLRSTIFLTSEMD